MSLSIFSRMAEKRSVMHSQLMESVVDPVNFQLRIFKELTTDPEGALHGFVDLIRGNDETKSKIEALRRDMFTRLEVNEHLIPGTVDFDNRLIDILNTFDVLTIERLAKSMGTFKSVCQDPMTPHMMWKYNFLVEIKGHVGKFEKDCPFSHLHLNRYVTPQDICQHFVKEHMVNWIRQYPCTQDYENDYEFQSSRMGWVKNCIMAVAIKFMYNEFDPPTPQQQ